MPLKKYDDTFKANLLKKYLEYIETEDFPYLARFAVENGIATSTIHHFPDFEDALKKGNDKCHQWNLQKLQDCPSNEMSKYMFLLKCMNNYRENTPIEVNVSDNKSYVQINITGKNEDELQDLADNQIKKIKELNIRSVKKKVK